MLLENAESATSHKRLVLLDCFGKSDTEAIRRLAIAALRWQFETEWNHVREVSNSGLLFVSEQQIQNVDRILAIASISEPELREDLIHYASDLSNRFDLSGCNDTDLCCVFGSGLTTGFEIANKWRGLLSLEVVWNIRGIAIGRHPDWLFTYGLESLPSEKQGMWVTETGSATIADAVVHVKVYRGKEDTPLLFQSQPLAVIGQE